MLINSYFVYLLIDNIKEFWFMIKKSGELKGCGFIEFGDKVSYWVSEIIVIVWRFFNVLYVNNDLYK